MKDPEINLIKSPQSQQKSAKDTKASVQETRDDFEKKLKSSQSKLDKDPVVSEDYLSMIYAMSMARYQQQVQSDPSRERSVGGRSSADNGIFFDPQTDRIGTAERMNGESTRHNSDNAGTLQISKQSKEATQAELIKALMAMAANGSSAVPFPLTNLLSKLEQVTNNLDIKVIADKIIESAKALKINDKTELMLNLKPDWLGDMTLNISSDKGVLTIQILANGKTKELMDSQISELEAFLKSANLNVGSINVSVGNRGSENNYGSQEQAVEIQSVPGMEGITWDLSPEISGNISLAGDITRMMNNLSVYSRI